MRCAAGPADSIPSPCELISQRRDAAFGEPARIRFHALVSRPRPGAVREQVERLRRGRSKQQARDLLIADTELQLVHSNLQ
jgi:hypothetical protein